MANSYNNATKITKEALRLLVNELTFLRNVRRGYDDQYKMSGAKIGNTLRIRKPSGWTVRSGATFSAVDFADDYVNLTVDAQRGIDCNFTTEELTMHLDDFSEQVLKPQMADLANYIEDYCLGVAYQGVYNHVGTPGTTPNKRSDILDAGKKLDKFSVPRDGQRYACVDPDANAALVDAMAALFNPGNIISRQFKKGLMGQDVLGFDEFSMNQNIRKHTVGAHGGTPLVNGASQTGTSLITDGWTASTAVLKAGDVITIADVYSVGRRSPRRSTGDLQQFVVTADATSDAGGDLTISISPGIDATGGNATVDAVPADDAAITVVGTASTAYPQNLMYHKDAFVFGSADLELPPGDFVARENYKGISMRLWRNGDIANDKVPCRFDVLIGFAVVRPEMACRLTG